MDQALVAMDASGNKTVRVLDVLQDPQLTGAEQRLSLGG